MAEEPTERSVKDLVKCLETQLKLEAKPKVPPKPNVESPSAPRTLNEVVSVHAVSSAILYFVVRDGPV